MEVVVAVAAHGVAPSAQGWIDPPSKIARQIHSLHQGGWIQLLIEGRECCEAAFNASVRRRRTTTNDTLERKAERAQMLVMMGEVLSGRRALEGAPLAPGNDVTLTQLRRRPQVSREPLPPEITGRRPESPCSLDHILFTQNFRCARRGAAAGPSGVTEEHLKPILDSARDAELLCQAAELMAKASIPEVLKAIRMGRMIALQKPSGGVRGIVAGDIIRRLVSRTMAQQIRTKVEKATARFQFALSTRAGCECIAHAIQAMTRKSTVHSSVCGWDWCIRSHAEQC